MGDHRADVKIEMEFHGVKDKCDMWINYMGDSSFAECEGVDDRIVKFIRNIYEKGMTKYRQQMEEYYEKEHAEDIRKGEEREFERLKKKLGKD
ncbi:MAG: hypothetical protein ACLP3B_06450 [Syntrophobacteraceae bacterium]